MKTNQQLQKAIKNYQDGNQDSFQFIYNDTYAYLHTCVIHIVKNEETAMDMLQETYLEICKNISQLKDPEGFHGWAATIANRKCFAYLKKQKDVLLFDSEDREDDHDSVMENIADDDQIIPESILQDQEKQHLMKEIIDGLSDIQRMCVIGFYYNEQKQEEIAEELGIPVNTVKSHLNRAKTKIKESVIDLDKNKGTRLYSIAPFLLLFFTKEESACSVASMSESLESAVLSTNAINMESLSAPVKAVKTLTRTKLIASVAGVVCIGAVVAGIAIGNHQENSTTAQASEISQDAEKDLTDEISQKTDLNDELDAVQETEVQKITETVTPEPEVEEPLTFAEENHIVFSEEKTFSPQPWALIFTDEEHTMPMDYAGVSAQLYDGTTNITNLSSQPSEKPGYKDIMVSYEANFSHDIILNYELYNDDSYYWSYTMPLMGIMDLYTGNSFPISDVSEENPVYTNELEIEFNQKKYDISYQIISTRETEKGEWEMIDDWRNKKLRNYITNVDAIITVPDDYDGLALYFRKNGSDEVNLEDDIETNSENLHSILLNDEGIEAYTVNDFYFVKPE